MSNTHELPGDRDELTELARDLLHAHPDAEDVAQEAWLLYQREPPGRVRSVGAWLRVALRHLALRSRRRDRLRVQRERSVARPERVPSVLEHLEHKAQAELLLTLIESLGEPYRQVVLLRYAEEREIEEIAAQLGRSPATVRSQLKRGLDQLRVRLGCDPRRRRFLSLLAVWRRRPRAGRARRWGLETPALVLCAGTCALVLALLHFGTRSTPTATVAFAPMLAAVEPEVPVLQAPPASRRSLLLPSSLDAPVMQSPVPGGIHVEGRVLRSDGSPLPGAAILVGSEGDEGRIVAYSDGQGRYELQGVDERLLLWAASPGSLSSPRHWIGSKPPGRALDLCMSESVGALQGRVSTLDGRPVGDAEVLLCGADAFLRSTQDTMAQGPPPQRTSTASDGSFRFEFQPAGEYRLFVRADGQAPFFLKNRGDVVGDAMVEIRLPPPSALQGVVLGPDGKPAAGAHLRLRLTKPLPPCETVADEQGRFDFEELPAGAYVLQLLEPLAWTDASCVMEGELAAGERVTKTVTLATDATIGGWVLDGTTPLAHWVVELQTADQQGFPRDLRRTTTGDDGSFVLPSASAGPTNVLRLFEPGAENGIPCCALWGVEASTPQVLRPAALESASLTGRFLESRSGRLPVIAVLRSRGLSAPFVLQIDPITGAFAVSHLPAGDYVVRAWVPGVGVWNAGSMTLHGPSAEWSAQVPDTGELALIVDALPSERNALHASIMVPSLLDLDAVSSFQSLAQSARGYATTTLFAERYALLVQYRGVLYETRTMNIDAGVTRIEEIVLRDVVPMTLELHVPSKLGRDKLTLRFHEPGGERVIQAPVACRTRQSDEMEILVAPGATAIEASSPKGLYGRLVLAPGDVVPEGRLVLTLEARSGD